MTEAITAAALQWSQGGAATLSSEPVQAGWGVSLTDLSSFSQAMQSASQRLEAHAVDTPANPVARALFQPLDLINREATELSQLAVKAVDTGATMTPGEVVALTVRSQEFLFHTQLTANAANRTSDGLQQLFRQQS